MEIRRKSRIKRGLKNAPCFQPPMKISRRGKEILAGSVLSVLEQVLLTIGKRSKINHEDALKAIGSFVFHQAKERDTFGLVHLKVFDGFLWWQ